MNPKYLITKATHIGGHLLRIEYGDGAILDHDFGIWLDAAKRNPYEKRYRAPEWFAKVQANPGYLNWGDYVITMSAEDIREGNITGVEVKKKRAA